MPMHFIVMNLMGKFKLLLQGHQYPLNVIDTLMNYTSCKPPFTKEADEVVHVYLPNLYSMFGGLHKILSYNGTEFKNKLFSQVSSKFGNETGIQFSLLSSTQWAY